eukprot:jgi/Mesvir1/20673/Mv14886-RA.1
MRGHCFRFNCFRDGEEIHGSKYFAKNAELEHVTHWIFGTLDFGARLREDPDDCPVPELRMPLAVASVGFPFFGARRWRKSRGADTGRWKFGGIWRWSPAFWCHPPLGPNVGDIRMDDATRGDGPGEGNGSQRGDPVCAGNVSVAGEEVDGSGAGQAKGEAGPGEASGAGDATSSPPEGEGFGGWLDRLLDLRRGKTMWTVPWPAYTVLQVMFLWFSAFWMVGSFLIPGMANAIGCNRATLSFRGLALYSLVTDVAEMVVGLGILYRCLAPFRPFPPGDWFPIKWRGHWYIEALFGCLLFPLVNLLSQINQDLVPIHSGSLPLGLPLDQSPAAMDPVANAVYLVVVSVFAPIWEEVIFRGFLLPSLTRYLPLWASIGLSSLAFALAHFSMQRLLPLSFLGVVMGVIFVRSRNLLSSILLHSLWNGFVFLELFR